MKWQSRNAEKCPFRVSLHPGDCSLRSLWETKKLTAQTVWFVLLTTPLIVRSVLESIHSVGWVRRCSDKLISHTEIKQKLPPCCGEPVSCAGPVEDSFPFKAWDANWKENTHENTRMHVFMCVYVYAPQATVHEHSDCVWEGWEAHLFAETSSLLLHLLLRVGRQHF